MPNTRNRSSFRSTRSGIVRPTKWVASADSTAVTGLSASSVLLDQSFTSVQLTAVAQAGGTVVRTRGILWVKSDQATATEAPIGALGMMVVRDAARAIGVTAVPTPVTDSADDGFFVHQFWQGGIDFNQVDASGVQIWNGWHRFDFDSKAQRRFNADDAIVVTMENSAAAHGCAFILNFRMLLKPGTSA